jgi:hypothetical protein
MVSTIQRKTGRGFFFASHELGTLKMRMKKILQSTRPMIIQGNLLPNFFENGAPLLVTYPMIGSFIAFQSE